MDGRGERMSVWKRILGRMVPVFAAMSAMMLAAQPARADLVLSQVIVDLQPGKPGREDIELWNNGPERIFVVADPAEIVSPGMPGETRNANPDPGVSGLLVTPRRVILEPDQRKLLRIAAVAPRAAVDRIYRVTVKPVAGDVAAPETAIKVLIGYDVLVIYRPGEPAGGVTATREPRAITLTNQGNTNVEVYEGRQCDAAGANCRDLPARRLYAGASLRVAIDHDTPVTYRVSDGRTTVAREF